MTRGRIAVTGVGMVNALGTTAAVSFERLFRGERGISEISLFDTSGQRTGLGAEVREFRPEAVVPAPVELWSRSDALAWVAAKDALASAGIAANDLPLGIAVGVTTSGMLETESLLTALGGGRKEPPTRDLASYPLNSTVDRLASMLGNGGPVATICSACSSGANAIIEGALWLQLGRAERVLVGGTDALCRLTLTGFNALGATDVVPCRPFDARRAGLTLGEGAAFLVLEPERVARARGAKVLAWLSGWSVGAEAHHITQPDPSGRLPASLLLRAIRHAGLDVADVDYVNAHGTGTVTNDVVETLAIRQAFGAHADRVLVSSSKGQIGHTLGAAGALEAAITVLSVAAQRVCPTAGLEEPDEACRLNHVRGQGVTAEIRAAASNSFGFGGTGAVLLFERADARPRRDASPSPDGPIAITGFATFDGRGASAPTAASSGEATTDASPPATDAASPLDTASLLSRLDASRSRRFDAAAALVTLSATAALEHAGVDRATTGLVSSTAFGNVTRTAAFLHALEARGPKRAPPAEFPHLLPSAASGNASIYIGLGGPVLATSALEVGGESAFELACDFIEAGVAVSLLAGGAESADLFVSDVFAPGCESFPERRTEGAAYLVLEQLASARRRGREPFAVVRRRDVYEQSAVTPASFGVPRKASRAVLFAARTSPAIRSVLEQTAWANARRESVTNDGAHEASGALALAAATALIAGGEVDEALVVGETALRLHVIHLARPT
jgi:3-oxoacyl-[acyl-carrier-protein] synthase II